MSRYDNPYDSSGSNRARRRSSQTNQFNSGSAYSRSGSANTYSREGTSYDQYRADARESYNYQRGRSTARRPCEDSAYEPQRSDAYGASNYQRSTNVRGSSGVRSGGTSYSRYDSGARYAQQNYERTGGQRGSGRARDNRAAQQQGGYVPQNNNYADVYEEPKKRGFKLPSISLPSFGRRSSSSHGYGRGGRRLDINFSAVRGPILGIVAGAVALIVIILLWSNRKIDITLNGESTQVRAGSTVQQVIDSTETKVNPGNLISVSGKTLEADQGYAFLVKLNDEELDGEATENYRASEGDSLTIEDGRDRTEDYDVEIQEEAPKLEMGGDAWGNITYVSQWGRSGKVEVRTGKISGETALGDTVEETQNCIVSVHQIKPSDGRKLICLTFDDGPAESYTEKYLDILDQYGIHATFFNLGQNVQTYPELAKKIVAQGSEIMSHTYQHQQLSTLDEASLQSEFSNAFSDIEENVGVTTTAFRPPYGDFTESCWLKSGGLASVSVLWNLDSEDWRRLGADSIVSKSTSGAFSGAIILMHDGGGDRSQDVEALPRIIETLQGEGYEFVTVSELMKSDTSIPEDIASGAASMPEGCTWPTEIADSSAS